VAILGRAARTRLPDDLQLELAVLAAQKGALTPEQHAAARALASGRSAWSKRNEF
jgi:hypothetical protein